MKTKIAGILLLLTMLSACGNDRLINECVAEGIVIDDRGGEVKICAEYKEKDNEKIINKRLCGRGKTIAEAAENLERENSKSLMSDVCRWVVIMGENPDKTAISAYKYQEALMGAETVFSEDLKVDELGEDDSFSDMLSAVADTPERKLSRHGSLYGVNLTLRDGELLTAIPKVSFSGKTPKLLGYELYFMGNRSFIDGDTACIIPVSSFYSGARGNMGLMQQLNVNRLPKYIDTNKTDGGITFKVTVFPVGSVKNDEDLVKFLKLYEKRLNDVVKEYLLKNIDVLNLTKDCLLKIGDVRKLGKDELIAAIKSADIKIKVRGSFMSVNKNFP